MKPSRFAKSVAAFLLLTVLCCVAQTVIQFASVLQWSQQTPGLPPFGSYYTYVDATGTFVCKTSTGASCLGSGSSGTVTSVTFTGDGTVLSSTPSAAVTTAGTLTATLANAASNVVLAGPASGSAAPPTYRALVAADLPTAATFGTWLPLAGFMPTGADVTTVLVTNNNQFNVFKFIMPYTVTVSHVSVDIGTGLTAALMGIAIYDATGTTKLANADGFSVDTTHTGLQRINLSGSITLRAGTAYYVGWTITSNATVTVENVLLTSQYETVANAAAQNVGASGTSGASGVTPSATGTISTTVIRVPLMYFD